MTETTGRGQPSAPDSVTTQPGGPSDGPPGCLYCGKPLRPPAKKNRPVKFCKGNKCRGMWHLERKRGIIAAIKAKMLEIERLVEELR